MSPTATVSPCCQFADDRRPEIVQAVTADGRHRQVGQSRSTATYSCAASISPYPDATHLEMPAEKLDCPLHGDRERVADHPDFIVEIEQERLPLLQLMKCSPRHRAPT